jgi:hypothetical protein
MCVCVYIYAKKQEEQHFTSCKMQSHNTRIEAQGERRYSSYSFWTSAVDGVSCQRHASAALYPQGKTPGTHWIGGWVGLRVGLDTGARGKVLLPLPGVEPRLLSPVRSHTLH